jgi:hypothetical protein
VDAKSAPTGLCKTADGFAQLPHASSSYLEKNGRAEPLRIVDQRPTDSAEEAIYANAKLSRDYATWKFAAVLEARIAEAQGNLSAFNEAQDAAVRPIMINSAFACTGCHQQ